MSSLRNAVSRRTHKERSQPQSREKWGLLEKHKDYSLRAQDYNLKKRKLSQLSQKTKDRHPDEFAFGMMSSRTAKQGQHGRPGDSARLSHDTVQLLKTQDSGYLRTVASKSKKDLERTRQALGLASVLKGEPLGKKTLFTGDGQLKKQEVDDNIRAMAKSRSDSITAVDQDADDVTHHPSLDADERLNSTAQTSRKALEKQRKLRSDLRAERKRRRRLAELRASKLDSLKRRQKEIMAVADQLELQRAKMAASIGGVNKDGVKFRIRERKR